MIVNLSYFAAGAILGAALVAWYARGIIKRIRADWKTANAVRARRTP